MFWLLACNLQRGRHFSSCKVLALRYFLRGEGNRRRWSSWPRLLLILVAHRGYRRGWLLLLAWHHPPCFGWCPRRAILQPFFSRDSYSFADCSRGSRPESCLWGPGPKLRRVSVRIRIQARESLLKASGPACRHQMCLWRPS